MDRIRLLLSACEHGDIPSVQALMDEGQDVDSTDADETTPLQVAAANGHDHIVRLLLMRGAALDRRNVYGWTPLMQASRHGHANVVATLLQQRQADTNAKNRLGASSLTLAARGGHLQVVRLLVDFGSDLNASGNSASGECEFTPLLAAAQHGHDAVLRFILDRGSDVNYRTPSTGQSALMLAALNGHMKTAQILVERGCDPNVVNVDNKTALEIATRRGRREVASYLDRKTINKPKIEPEEVKPDIIEAAKHGDILRIQAILDKDLSQIDASSPQDGATPLMFAAMTGQLDVARLLVARECDINKQDSISGWTALMQATYHGKKSVAVFLIEQGADVTIQAKNGCTAFDMALIIEDVDTELLRLLASKAMSVNKEDKGKKSSAKQNGLNKTFTASESGVDEQPKSGLKAWLSRLTSRIKNTKLGRTMNSTNRLTPVTALHTSTSVQDLTLTIPKSPLVPPRKTNNFMDQSHISTSYDQILLENKKSASMYTLDINPPNSNLTSETLKPVIPPFLPTPTFDLDISSPRSKPLSARGPDTNSTLHSPNRPMMKPPMMFMPNKTSSNLSSSPASPSSSGRFVAANQNNGDYNENGIYSPTNNKGPLVFLPPQTPSRLFMPRKSSVPSAFRTASNTTSPNSSTSGSSSVTPQRSHSHGRSTSSKESTTSTLTPSPSPTPGKFQEDPGHILSSLHENESNTNDELSGILKKLSLEKYQPIFEEQEVDMEAFLTLNDTDLNELGISHTQSRQQILKTISELKTGKGKERQQFVDTMTTFQSTLRVRPADPSSRINGWSHPSSSGDTDHS
ncbi:ankyrin repeat and SAM domain-containing protein 6-like [Argopecten irradians]|uniref:ankyrin repeat and SAM domain-containing protein 6-like n=1 Tax=Argopecten irradians TaxID=31199 RepID=UPI0037186487